MVLRDAGEPSLIQRAKARELQRRHQEAEMQASFARITERPDSEEKRDRSDD